eukprot:1735525-Amphidinium_carterae.1
MAGAAPTAKHSVCAWLVDVVAKILIFVELHSFVTRRNFDKCRGLNCEQIPWLTLNMSCHSTRYKKL